MKKKEQKGSFNWDENILGLVDTAAYENGVSDAVAEKHVDIEFNQKPKDIVSTPKKTRKVAHKTKKPLDPVGEVLAEKEKVSNSEETLPLNLEQMIKEKSEEIISKYGKK